MAAQTFLQALDLNQAKNGSIVAIVVCVAIVLVVLKFISSLIARLILSVVFAALGVVVYTQRASLLDCVDKVSASVAAGDVGGSVGCNFFGREVTFSLDPVSPEG